MSHWVNGQCDKPGCTRYSDVDVYYSDQTRTPSQMCAEHAWDEPGTCQLAQTPALIRTAPASRLTPGCWRTRTASTYNIASSRLVLTVSPSSGNKSLDNVVPILYTTLMTTDTETIQVLTIIHLRTGDIIYGARQEATLDELETVENILGDVAETTGGWRVTVDTVQGCVIVPGSSIDYIEIRTGSSAA